MAGNLLSESAGVCVQSAPAYEQRTKAGRRFFENVIKTLLTCTRDRHCVAYDVFRIFEPPRKKGGCLLQLDDRLVILQWLNYSGCVEFIERNQIVWNNRGETRALTINPLEENWNVLEFVASKIRVPSYRIYNLLVFPKGTSIANQPDQLNTAAVTVCEIASVDCFQERHPVRPLSGQAHLDIFDELSPYGIVNFANWLLQLDKPVLKYTAPFIFPGKILQGTQTTPPRCAVYRRPVGIIALFVTDVFSEGGLACSSKTRCI